MKKVLGLELGREELLLVRGGTDKEKYNSVGEIVRRTNLKYAQDVVREAAIYRPYAKGNFDYEGAAEDVTWCNQSSYDVMEATGVHMEAFYGKPKGYKGKEGQRGAGYWVNANTACKNVENYIDKYAKEWVNAKIKEVGLTNIEAGFDYIGPNSVKNYNEAYTKKYNELYAEGKADCPIQEITAEQAQDLANQGYTVVVMWENTKTDKKGNRYSGHISTVRPYFRKDEEDKGPRISNVGRENELSTVSKSFQNGFEDGTVKYYYDRNQTFRANEGFERYGLAYNDLTKKQSISIHDPTYDENNYINYGKRKAEENEYLGKLKEERLEELKNSVMFSEFRTKDVGFPFSIKMVTNTAKYIVDNLDSIDKRAKELKNNNMTLLSIIRKGDKNVDDVLLGRITAGDYIEQKKAERAAQEKAIAEAEAKRIAEEKAAREKAEKERLEREKEERKKKEASDNSDSGRDSNDSDENTDESIDDHDDNGEETITTPPENTGDGNQTPPTDGDGENPAPPNEDPSPGNGGGGGSKPKPPKIPKPGDMIPLSIDTNNEYYLGSLYGTKPFSAQESSAFNSTIISNELSALQPITSLNVAGFPVNDTAIKTEQFGA
ncbi:MULTISPECIES: hypothetical protein [Treponema]|uniref:hypothetical protein n=1 Tax=Treponema TaxID=157 RepID=UPI0002B54FA1|nr:MULTISPECIES: hypothetical protein [Treponema]EMB45562.1 hypothetical protein HMPREF9729_01314 [Treponema denticola ASLM]EMD57431.1 hypothetical protein HMPREF9728_00492 [Treponema denticola US-Trep]UTD10964.1 hypothetical protein HYB91_10670 [Treponema sp. B152]